MLTVIMGAFGIQEVKSDNPIINFQPYSEAPRLLLGSDQFGG